MLAHLVVPEFWSVDRAHELAEDLAMQVIKEVGVDGELSVHTDPCHRAYCWMCDLEDCPVRREPFRARPPLTLEEAVHVQTGKLAAHFGFADRGVLAAGMRGDITVFHLDEIRRREKKKVFDVPDGQGGHIWRWTRDPAPVRLTLVNGEATFENGAPTGARPGVFVRPQPPL